jgi:bile acid:Na+ symporter, BASS family
MIHLFISIVIFYLLFTVGTNLKIECFKFESGSVKLLFLMNVFHIVVVPLVAILLFLMASLDPVIGTGLLLIAAAPIGAMSNYYVNVARGDLALAIMLTGTTSLLSFITAPLICVLIAGLLVHETIGSIPFGQILRQTIPNVLVPVVAGMAVRHWMRDWIMGHQRWMETLGFAAVLVLVATVLTSQLGMLTASMVISAVWLSAVFTILLLCVGWCAARLTAVENCRQRMTALMFGFPARNIGLSTLLAANVFGKVELAAFGAIFFVTQLLMLVPFALWFRRSAAAAQ